MKLLDDSILEKYNRSFTQKRRLSARPYKNTLLVYYQPGWMVKADNNGLLNSHQHRIGRPKR